jgi:hypothetical protein
MRHLGIVLSSAGLFSFPQSAAAITREYGGHLAVKLASYQPCAILSIVFVELTDRLCNPQRAIKSFNGKPQATARISFDG